MNDIKDLPKILFGTGDGRSATIWLIIFLVLCVRSVILNGIELYQFKYIFFALIALLTLLRFRVSNFNAELRTNVWSLLNINAFGLIIIFMEF